MKRRDFLERSIVLGTTVGASSWLCSAWAQAPAVAVHECRGAWVRALARDVPLLAIVVPGDVEAAWERGSIWGVFLNHGPPEILAAFASVELVCARADELRMAIPDVQVIGDDAWLVRVTRAGEQILATPFSANVPSRNAYFAYPIRREGDPEPTEAEYRDLQRMHDAAVARTLDQQIAALTLLVQQALVHVLRGLNEVQRAVAIGEAQTRYIRARIPGSHWAHTSGCGDTIESPPSDTRDEARSAIARIEVIGCGMGSVPQRAQRFLHFFVQRPPGGDE